MAPVESFTQRQEQEPKEWFMVRPGHEHKTKKFPQAEIVVKCDRSDLDGTFKIKTEAPEYIGAFLFENDFDKDPKPLEVDQEHHFSGTQRAEIHSIFHFEIITLKHNVAAGVVVDTKEALEAETALAHVRGLIMPKPLLVGAPNK